MKATRRLNDLGQSLWIDNITREMLDSGTLARYIDELSVTGLTSNPTIFDHAIGKHEWYDEAIHKLVDSGLSGEALFFELAIQDLSRAADLFEPIHGRTSGVDGWVSLEVSPLFAYDTEKTVAQANMLHERANKHNLFIKIPGTPAGLPAIEEAIFTGVPVNVTLLFSREHYIAAAEAYMRGLERRVEAGKDADVRSVASLFVSRWDRAVTGKVPSELEDTLGIAVGRQCFTAYRDLLDSDRWQRLENKGARPQRLLFASTSTKNPKAPDVMYIGALAAPNTIDTMPEETLLAFHDHGAVEKVISRDGAEAEAALARLTKAGVDLTDVAAHLQKDGADSFVASWQDLLKVIETKSKELA